MAVTTKDGLKSARGGMPPAGADGDVKELEYSPRSRHLGGSQPPERLSGEGILLWDKAVILFNDRELALYRSDLDRWLGEKKGDALQPVKFDLEALYIIKHRRRNGKRYLSPNSRVSKKITKIWRVISLNFNLGNVRNSVDARYRGALNRSSSGPRNKRLNHTLLNRPYQELVSKTTYTPSSLSIEEQTTITEFLRAFEEFEANLTMWRVERDRIDQEISEIMSFASGSASNG